MPEWKHRQAERDLAPLLRAASTIDPSIESTFPRPVVDILAASLPALDVHRTNNLDMRTIVARLGDDYGLDQRALLDDGNTSLGGFTYADHTRAFIFVETKYGADFESFTLAHEAGHIVKELLPRLAMRKQVDLFSAPTGPLIAHRDPPEVIFDGGALGDLDLPREERLRAMKAQAESWLKEVIANTCAAELLAPWRAVERVVAEAPAGHDLVEHVRSTFGLSRRAARLRLEELGLLSRGGPRLL